MVANAKSKYKLDTPIFYISELREQVLVIQFTGTAVYLLPRDDFYILMCHMYFFAASVL